MMSHSGQGPLIQRVIINEQPGQQLAANDKFPDRKRPILLIGVVLVFGSFSLSLGQNHLLRPGNQRVARFVPFE